MYWLVLIGVGLGTAWAVNALKQFGPPLGRLTKAFIAFLAATNGSVFLLLGAPARTVIVVALGANGLAMVTHQLTAALQSKKDLDRLTVRKNLHR